MSNGNDPKSWASFAHRLLGEDGIDILKPVIIVVIFMGLMFFFIALPTLATHPEEFFGSSRKCFDLKEIQGQLYQVNQCNGHVTKLDKKGEPAGGYGIGE